MRKLFACVFICLCMVVSNFAQAQKPLLNAASLAKKPVFRSLEEAIKTPLEVYKLDLSFKDLNQYPQEI